MTIRARIFIAGMLISLIFSVAPPASAYSVAVLPVADLTEDQDGVNFVLAEHLADQLRLQGLDVIPLAVVLKVMVRQGVRHCDKLDSFSCRRLALALKCDSVLVTTLYRRSDAADQNSLILTLLHGKTGQPVWGKLVSDHLDDVQPLFGMGANRDLGMLQRQQIEEIGRQLIRELPVLPDVQRQNPPPFQVTDVQFNPSLIQGGKPVHCRLKISFLEEEPERLELIGGQVPIALHRSRIPGVYTGTFLSRNEEGEQQISLTFKQPGKSEAVMSTLGSYQVVNSPVLLSLEFLNSFRRGDVYAFSDEIKIVPRIKPRRPLELWRFTMRDGEGNVVFSETQYSSLPKEMHWRGTNSSRQALDSGYYTLTFAVRDLAGNEAEVCSKLYLQSTREELAKIRQQIKKGHPQLELVSGEALMIPVDRWVLTLEAENGEPLLTRKGIRLPVKIVIPPEISRRDPVCHFTIQDRLGNHYSAAETRLEKVVKEKSLAQVKPLNTWKADF